MSTTTTTEPQVYLACLGCYNEGRLTGRWIHPQTAIDEAELEGSIPPETLTPNLAGCKHPWHEEIAIHDSEGLGKVGEWDQLDMLAERAEAIEEHGDAMIAYIKWIDGDDLSGFTDCYRGEWSSWLEFVEEFVDDLGVLRDAPTALAQHFDYASYGRELEQEYHMDDGHIFLAC